MLSISVDVTFGMRQFLFISLRSGRFTSFRMAEKVPRPGNSARKHQGVARRDGGAELLQRTACQYLQNGGPVPPRILGCAVSSTCAMSSDLTITRRRDCCDGSCLKGLSGRFERKPATAIPYALLNKNLRRRFPAPSGSRCRSHRIKQFNCLRRVYGPMAGLRSNLPHEPSCPLRLLDFTNSAVALRAGQVRSSFYQMASSKPFTEASPGPLR